ncbi:MULTISPECIES: hypothetical protein [unclassified Enterococcus]|nr:MULTISPECIES: hypothetical protein [unclassified Enterococcus]MBS7576384.1 hypothetical protein [Enterococcus sp. MMGLQ5-2]MBS7583616.1 hypothetical protein [Enterococcus sp. MMGLQ5-1]NPD11477.1 hypothetical protein [Enterococcus sp. MMGLQ5-1]NPD36221.1 hypothetical protein [Enterococcus sp. MMGLQ5-2]
MVIRMLGDIIKIILIIIFTVIFIWSSSLMFKFWQDIVERNHDEGDK